MSNAEWEHACITIFVGTLLSGLLIEAPQATKHCQYLLAVA